MKIESVVITVPVYKSLNNLENYERISLHRLFQMLGSHKIVFFTPKSFSLEDYTELANTFNVCIDNISFDDKYFVDSDRNNDFYSHLSNFESK